MASRAARDMASCMKSGGKAKKPMPSGKKAGKHDDTAEDKALVKKMVKPSAMKPQAFAAGGVAKARHGQSGPGGQQRKATAPLKSPIGKVGAPKQRKAMI